MKKRRLPLVVGINSEGKLVPILRAKRGLKCKCVCPACGARLSAKRGKIMTHHFAHYRVDECDGAVETALHRFAKAVLHFHRSIKLPPVFARGITKPLLLARQHGYQDSAEEVGLNGFVADVILYNGVEKLVVELKVTHEVDPYKQRIFLRSGVTSLEIDVLAIFEELSQEGHASDTTELAKRIIDFGGREGGMAVHGRWLFHPRQHNAEYQRRTAARSLKVRHSVWRGYQHFRTIGCPCPKRQRFSSSESWDKGYARTYQECVGCPHLVELEYHYDWVGYQWVPVKLKGVKCGYETKGQ